MIKSMTGFGRFSNEKDGYAVTAEIKSVNNRYLDISCRIPRIFNFLEDKLRAALQKAVYRGKLEVFITIQRTEGSDARVEADAALAGEYISALRRAAETLNLTDDLKLSSLLRFPDIFRLQKNEDDEKHITELVMDVFNEAFLNFDKMKTTEGNILCADILSRLDEIEKTVDEVEPLWEAAAAIYRENLTKRITEVLDGRTFEESRILTEAAIFAEKTCVNEETVRLKSHFRQFRKIFSSPGPAGKKIDFLLQEIGREINTIGSKSSSAELTEKVIFLKSEAEKIREQVQNIE